MPLIVHLKSGTSYLIDGEQNPLAKPSFRRLIKARNLKSGNAAIVRRSEIVMCEVWPNADYNAALGAEAEAQEAAQKRNPNPGREPRILVPRRPS